MPVTLRTSHYHSRGFTLLEVIVAFAILALSLGVIYQIFGQSLKAADLSEQYTEATIVAQSLLAEVGVTSPLEAGTQDGQIENVYQWQVITQLLAEPTSDEITPASYEVEVIVRWGDAEQEIRLHSIRLRNAEQ